MIDDDTDGDIAAALQTIGTHLKYLGNGDAATTIGAIEGHAMQLRDGAQLIAAALDNLADAVREISLHCSKCCEDAE